MLTESIIQSIIANAQSLAGESTALANDPRRYPLVLDIYLTAAAETVKALYNDSSREPWQDIEDPDLLQTYTARLRSLAAQYSGPPPPPSIDSLLSLILQELATPGLAISWHYGSGTSSQWEQQGSRHLIFHILVPDSFSPIRGLHIRDTIEQHIDPALYGCHPMFFTRCRTHAEHIRLLAAGTDIDNWPPLPPPQP